MTLREIEEKILARLQDGTGRAYEDGLCVYRDSLGRKCALGCLISDEAYDPRLEGLNVYCGGVVEMLLQSGISPDLNTIQALVMWQDRHDRPENWAGNEYIGPTSFKSEDETDEG